ncbi:MAG: 50S ribosomal protein L23 [bacterium]|nr:50S ribosomal protein L23 [bacterium]
MRNARQVILRPVMSEKSTAAMAQGKYTFVVAPDATKVEIRQAVEEIFRVKVTKVNTQNRQGKLRRMGVHRGYRPDTKKAVVTLAEGQSIKFFEDLR